MKERKTITKALSEQYRRASKKDKGNLLNQFVEATGYDRCYARRLLRNHGRKVWACPGVTLEGDARIRRKRVGLRKYGDEVFKSLKKIWELLDFISSKRLAAALHEVVSRLVAFKELKINKAVQKQLLTISPATIDRLLRDERKKHTLKGRATTKPGTLLKHQIPFRTFSDWSDVEPGFFEMDLVGHDGGKAQGDYCFTLDLVDVATGWTEQAAVQNKAQIWVFDALKDIRNRLPFPMLGLHSDNGSEFINHHMLAYCSECEITFTRSRPYQKNDNCYIEQKNWSTVRRNVGYARYDTPAACALLNQLYLCLRDYNNFFMPSAKLKEKKRDGAKVHKRYDTPQTPYQRILASNTISQKIKDQLTRYYQKLNPAELHRKIRKLQRQLDKLAARNQKPLEES